MPLPPDAIPVLPEDAIPISEMGAAQVKDVGTMKALGLGALQGATAGTADELAAAGLTAQSGARSLNQPMRQTPGPKVLAKMYPGVPYAEAAAKWFEANRPDVAAASEAEAQRQGQEGRFMLANVKTRAPFQEAQASSPKAYLAGQIVGGAATAPASMGLKGAAGLGALQGFGYSEAGRDEPTGLASDIGIGAVGGLAGQAIGKGLAAVGSKVRGAIDPRIQVLRQKAAELAAAKVNKPIAQAAASLGGETQVGSRYVENLMRLEQSMTPAQKAEYAKLVAAGVVPDLQQSVAQGTLSALPGQARTIAARKAELEALQKAAPAALAKATQEAESSSLRPDARSLFKAYGEPALWAAGGLGVANALDLSPTTQALVGMVAGSIGGRTRAGKASRLRLQKPGNQMAVLRGLENVSSGATGAKSQAFARALAAALAAQAVTNQEGD